MSHCEREKRKYGAHHDVSSRARAVADVLRGGSSYRAAAAKAGVSPNTVRNWVLHFDMDGSFAPAAPPGRPRKKMTTQVEEFVMEKVRHNSAVTYPQVRL